MSEYGKEVAKKMSDYMGNIDSVDKEVHDIQHATKGVEVRGALAAGVSKTHKVSKQSESISDDTKRRQDSVEQQFDDLQQNYTEDSPSDAEIVAARTNTETGDNHTTVGRRMDAEYKQVTAQLADIAVNIVNFETIQHAIDYVHDSGGGKVLFPKGVYDFSSDLHVKEGVDLEGHRNGTILNSTVNKKARIIPYNLGSIKGIDIKYPKDYNDSAFYFSNEYLESVNKRDDSSDNTKSTFQEVRIISEFNAQMRDKVGFKLFATQSGDAQALRAGYAGLVFRDCSIIGFTFAIDLETEMTGWINGNLFDNVSIRKFETAVRVRRSEQTLGVDYNIFRLYIQADENTKDIFIDDYVTNNYTDCTFWDMEEFTESRIGTGSVKNVQNGVSYPKEKYADYLRKKHYHLLGRFTLFTHRVNHIMISLTGRYNYKTDYYIGGDGVIERRTHGSNRLDDGIRFFKRELPSGDVEIYLYNDLDIEIETNVYFESFRSFYPSPRVLYDYVDGLTELTDIEDFYSSPKGMYTTGENNNGTWVKYDDGTMICQLYRNNSTIVPNIAIGSMYRSENETWVFPQKFVDTPHVTITGLKSHAFTNIPSTPSVESCSYRLYQPVESSSTTNLSLTAIGRWKGI